MTAIGIILFVLAIGISVMLHEAGHFLTARAFGMKATEFFLGFGPRLFSFHRGETEYGIRAIPAGGFVRIVGMDESEEVSEEDAPRAFWRFSTWKRVVVLSTGSVVHILIAFVLFMVVLMALGTQVVSTQLAQVPQCPQAATGQATPPQPCSTTYPAAAAGLRPGDTITQVDSHSVDATSLLSSVQSSQGRPLTLTVTHAQEPTRSVQVTPVKSGETYVLGIVLGEKAQKHSFSSALSLSGSALGTTVVGSLKGLAHIPASLPKLFSALVGHTQRDPNGLVGVVGAAQVSSSAVSHGNLAGFLLIIASLNVFIGVFNMLPLLPMDGGHVAIALFERTRSLLARAFHRPDPGRVDMKRVIPVAYTVMVLLVSLSLLLLVADVVAPVSSPF